MKLLLFGASGMVGQGVLREALLADDVISVSIVSRAPSGNPHPKVTEIVLPDLAAIDTIAERLADADVAVFAIGVSAAGLSEGEYARLNHDLVLDVARALAARNPAMAFIYVSAAGADSEEKSAIMWARVRGRTENALRRLPFRAVHIIRPAMIQPMHGIVSRTKMYRILYAALAPLLPLAVRLFPGSATTTERLGRAVLRIAREGNAKPILETRELNALGA